MNYTACISSPIGRLLLEASDAGLQSLKIVTESEPITLHIPPQLHHAAYQLKEYFDGTRTSLDVIIDYQNAPLFYYQVWKMVKTIPFGKTRSYSDIANHLNNPGAVRAVGMANGKNPIPIIIPCHRVVGKNGKLTGYLYGLVIKRKLLALENPRKYQIQGVLF